MHRENNPRGCRKAIGWNLFKLHKKIHLSSDGQVDFAKYLGEFHKECELKLWENGWYSKCAMGRMTVVSGRLSDKSWELWKLKRQMWANKSTSR